MTTRLTSVVVVLLLLVLSACHDMSNQDKATRYSHEAGKVRSAPDTVQYHETQPQPPPLTLALLQRGRNRFHIFCTACHSELGDGNGMVVQRGFPHPPSYLEKRLVQAPTQHFYDVMTYGYGAMYSFAGRISPSDRWAIAAYIRALQLSQHTPASDLSSAQQQAMR